MKVAKFGGSSVRDAEAFNRCLRVLEHDSSISFVILSATYNTTNDLESYFETKDNEILESIKDRHLSLAQELGLENKVAKEYIGGLISEITSLCSKDKVLSSGELISSFLFSEFLKLKLSKEVVLLDARDIIKINNKMGEPSLEHAQRSLSKSLDLLVKNKNLLFITQGFIGENENGDTVTLGREGSDYSATIIGSAINASEVQIWTDVDGIYDADPRFVPEAKRIDRISYEGATWLASHGAKVLFKKTLSPLTGKNIPVFVRSSFNPLSQGTLIEEVYEDSFVALTVCDLDQSLSILYVLRPNFEPIKIKFNSDDKEQVILENYNKYCL